MYIYEGCQGCIIVVIFVNESSPALEQRPWALWQRRPSTCSRQQSDLRKRFSSCTDQKGWVGE